MAKPNPKDEAFAKLVIEMKLASPSVVKQCLDELVEKQQQGETKLNLGILMIQKKLISTQDL